MIKVSLILISISSFAKAVCDAIRFHPGNFIFQNDWWLAKGDYAWNNRTWLEANIFSFVSDGWHCFDAIRISSVLLLAAIFIVKEKDYDHNTGWAVAIYLLGLYIIHGIIFEIFFRIL